MLQRALQSVQVEKVPASAEQLQADAARAKEYSRNKVRPRPSSRFASRARAAANSSPGAAQMAQHRAQQVDLGVKLRLRLSALEALPEARPHLARRRRARNADARSTPLAGVARCRVRARLLAVPASPPDSHGDGARAWLFRVAARRSRGGRQLLRAGWWQAQMNVRHCSASARQAVTVHHVAATAYCPPAALASLRVIIMAATAYTSDSALCRPVCSCADKP